MVHSRTQYVQFRHFQRTSCSLHWLWLLPSGLRQSEGESCEGSFLSAVRRSLLGVAGVDRPPPSAAEAKDGFLRLVPRALYCRQAFHMDRVCTVVAKQSAGT